MFKNLNYSFFFFCMLFGILISVSSNNWILIWCGLEITLICFLPLVLTKNFVSSECCLKYFIIQSISSSLFMLSFLFILMNVDINSELMLIISLMIKMGVSPFHTWVLNVIEGLSFKSMFLLLTFLKLPPLCILSYTSGYLFYFVVLTLIMSSIFGLNQNSFRKIIGYSSIFNMGFILSCMNINQVWLFYLFFYSSVILMLIFMLVNLNMNYLNQFIMNDFSPLSKFILLMSLLSMGGMPPLMGFMIKLVVLEILLFMNFFFLCLFMILTSLLVMFFYIRITFLSIMIYAYLPKINLNMINYNFSYLIIINLMSILIMINLKVMI
nr:NADH dehydrogenase subunit 2 [Alebroides salicis]